MSGRAGGRIQWRGGLGDEPAAILSCHPILPCNGSLNETRGWRQDQRPLLLSR